MRSTASKAPSTWCGGWPEGSQGVMRTAVLSDIHGNLPALLAVLADARAHDARAFLNLGDIVSGPLWPMETAELLMTLHWPTIAGNHERQVLTLPDDRLSATDRHTRAALKERHLQWLARHPAAMQPQPGLWCVHGTPGSDLVYLLETVTAPRGLREATDDEVRMRLGTAQPKSDSLLLCGHTHLPRDRVVDGLRIVNPGSVGLPAYDDDHPHPHDIETGTPQARYALVEPLDERGGAWSVELRAVAYDHEQAARQAEANGRGDWADALRSGRVGRREAEVLDRAGPAE